MKEKIRNYCIHFIKEIIPVIAGILIALFIDNWNSERKDKAFIKQVFSTVASELKDTNEDILEKIPIQESLIDSLNFYASNKNIKVSDVVMKCKGIYIPQIKINAWKTVSNTKIDLIDYEKITILSNIAEVKDLLNSKREFLMNFVYLNNNQTDKNAKQTFKLLILDIIQMERTIQKYIEFYKKQ
ncbi:hypothetical protein SF1_43420 [Sphingobacterium faecium NBRC 15299]|uniref:hypothetical protein n=1 Tax=Sphingobacterium faecium TaxID=34087 RepID=UPI000D345BB0|nr:hypothetical protein [Sphingobacterium faecium]MQP29540.1 hypothetical protein [Sphingobacterium faecium]PTX10224.1 hypothetical protein C8N37_105232 [Sphingobacterium faecium]GEM66360.1 hypothetical protein SF1_43420 [Sphingobacterium faecium NBRC 15299]